LKAFCDWHAARFVLCASGKDEEDKMDSLRHVQTAVGHADALADEAEGLLRPELAQKLRARARALAALLDAALAANERVPESREGRVLGHHELTSLYDDVTSVIDDALRPEAAARLSPGAYLDVAERARFRVRRLSAPTCDVEARVARELQRGVEAYETCVDAYLLATADARGLGERAVAESQLLRVELERAKRHLLTVAPVGSESWRRIKRRAVRTKKPRWLLRGGGDEALSSERALVAQRRVDPKWETKKAA
jgi:hypothetical protein